MVIQGLVHQVIQEYRVLVVYQDLAVKVDILVTAGLVYRDILEVVYRVIAGILAFLELVVILDIVEPMVRVQDR